MNPLLNKVVGWLRAGYPTGLPEDDYVPLMALLRRRLSDDEVKEVARNLRREDILPADKIDIGVGVTKVTQELPSETDMTRVAERLRSKGWPIESWNDTARAFEDSTESA